jgi:hypothetical protein
MRDPVSRSRRAAPAPRRCTFALLLVAALSAAAPAAAQTGAEPALPAARELWREGSSFYQSGDYLGAADRFDRAYEIEHSASLGIWVARAWSRGGRLMAALARYRELAEQPLPPDAPQREWAAKRDAQAEQQDLIARIPSIIVVVDGPLAERVAITINGEPLPRTQLGGRRLVDPGPVRIHGSDGQRVGDTEVVLREGEIKTAHLVLALPAPPPAPRRAEADKKGAPASSPGANGARVFSYVAMGVGGASLLTGVVFGFMALHDQANLKTLCPNAHCPPSLSSDVDTYEAEKRIAAVGLFAGAALSLTGVVVYFAAQRPEQRADVRVFFTGRSAGLAGHF